MIFIDLENSEAKHLADFIELEFPIFIQEGEIKNMNYIYNISSAYKKLRDELNKFSDCKTQNKQMKEGIQNENQNQT